ncbi:MAG: RHS repeat-associated core domain-containing protein, partial [Planctomycetota bacterium]|nr:RHS repeat-associated core domain-containing protein [Planctomycetota bacterium]
AQNQRYAAVGRGDGTPTRTWARRVAGAWDGYVFNAETLQYHVRHRCYSPTLGRWLERDPAGYFLGMSLYVYVRSGPLRFVDPWGLEEEDLPEGVKEISPSECWEDWKRKHKGFTDRELTSIHRIFQTGCIGITMINTGDPADPNLQNCYATVDRALKRQKEMQENCECKGKNNWQGDPSKPVIFFTDFLVKSANPICSDPDPNTGRIKFKLRGIPGPFNFAFFDQEECTWTYASEGGKNMRVYVVNHLKTYTLGYLHLRAQWGSGFSALRATIGRLRSL